MGEKASLIFSSACRAPAHPRQPCPAKTGDAEGNQQFLSLRLKVKLHQVCSGSRGMCFQWTPTGRDAPGAARDTQVCHHFTSSGSARTCQQTKAFCAWLFPRLGFPPAPLQTRGRLASWVSPSGSTEAENAWDMDDTPHSSVHVWLTASISIAKTV